MADLNSWLQIDAQVRERGIRRAIDGGELKLAEIAAEFGCEERTVARVRWRMRQAKSRERRRRHG